MKEKRNRCDRCDCEVSRFRDLKKVCSEFLCKDCYRENRENRRKDTIEISGIKRELSRLKYLETKKYYKPRPRKIRMAVSPPIPKGSKPLKNKQYSGSYLTMSEKQSLLRMLMDRGMDFDDAKDRISDLVEQLKIVREGMAKEDKSDKEIELKKQELLEELWNS